MAPAPAQSRAAPNAPRKPRRTASETSVADIQAIAARSARVRVAEATRRISLFAQEAVPPLAPAAAAYALAMPAWTQQVPPSLTMADLLSVVSKAGHVTTIEEAWVRIVTNAARVRWNKFQTWIAEHPQQRAEALSLFMSFVKTGAVGELHTNPRMQVLRCFPRSWLALAAASSQTATADSVCRLFGGALEARAALLENDEVVCARMAHAILPLTAADLAQAAGEGRAAALVLRTAGAPPPSFAHHIMMCADPNVVRFPPAFSEWAVEELCQALRSGVNPVPQPNNLHAVMSWIDWLGQRASLTDAHRAASLVREAAVQGCYIGLAGSLCFPDRAMLGVEPPVKRPKTN